jgi:hypothetical protein
MDKSNEIWQLSVEVFTELTMEDGKFTVVWRRRQPLNHNFTSTSAQPPCRRMVVKAPNKRACHWLLQTSFLTWRSPSISVFGGQFEVRVMVAVGYNTFLGS